MFFGKHHIVIFREGGEGKSRKFRVRLWVISLFVLFTCALLVGNFFLLKDYFANLHLENRIEENQERFDSQNAQLLSLVTKIQEISRDVLRMERFDAKIRQLLEISDEFKEVQKNRNEDLMTQALPIHSPSLMVRRMQTFLKLLADDVHLEEVNQQKLLMALRVMKGKLSSSPTVWPLRGRLNSSFGYRRAPFTGRRSFHKGIDIKGRIGAPIIATARGVVKKAGFDGAYGILVEIDHGGGISTLYAHMKSHNVKVGQEVKRGDVVGLVGMTGRTTGPHLHYEIRVGGAPVNPMKYILE